MQYFAELNTQTNTVLNVIVANKTFCDKLSGTYVRAYKDNANKNYPSKGDIYYYDKDNFSKPQPFPSWSLDSNCIWQPPVSCPEGESSYIWNEETQSWDEDYLI